MNDLGRNLRFALRQLRRAPGFTVTVVMILALGIGATTAIFSLVEGILLRPLPFKDPGRLVLVGDHLGDNPGIAVSAREISVYSISSGAFLQWAHSLAPISSSPIAMLAELRKKYPPHASVPASFPPWMCNQSSAASSPRRRRTRINL